MNTREPTEHKRTARLAVPVIVSVATAIALALALPALAAAAPTLTVQKGASTGTGTVTSSPAGIECGASCTAEFQAGATITLTGAPGANTAPVQWIGCDSVNVENKCLVTLSASKSVYATFDLEKHQLTVTKAGGGEGTVSSSPAGINACATTCQANFAHGAIVTLTGSPGANTGPAQWAGCDSVNAEDKCLVTISAARSVTATFDHPQFQLSVSKSGLGTGTLTSSPAGINCGSTCSLGFDQGSTVTLTATPGPHTLPALWSGCDSEPSANKCEVTLSKAKSVNAAFNPQPGAAIYALTVEKTGTGQGTVSGSPGSISCGATCSTELVEGTQLTLTASPAQGSVFAHWSGGGCAGAGPCTTTVNKAKTVKAVFSLSGQRTLTVSKAGSGSGTVTGKAAGIDCGATCSSQIAAGKKVTLSAKAATGSAFAHWSGACSGAGACKVTMTEARSVTATFSGGSSAASPPPSCVVPRLKGKSPRKARAALAAAHCTLGKVRKPIARKGRKLGPLVVKSFSPAAGSTLPAGGKVSLRLGSKPKTKHRRRGARR